MSAIFGRVFVGVAAAVLCGGTAIAQDLQEVTVQATRAFTTKATERTASGVPILDISVSYGVRTSDLNLATHSGATVLEQRVKDAALAACKEISRQYPDTTPSEAECANKAAAKAMTQVKLMVAAAEKARG